jgi:hypothetical protein
MCLLVRLLMRLLVCSFNTFCHHMFGFLCLSATTDQHKQ